MGSANIQAKIKKGLAKAINKTGSAASDKVYLVSETVTGGTPLAPGTVSTNNIELVNAVFTSYDQKHFDINILAGDRKLVCDNAVLIKQGDTIKQGSSTYYVVNIDTKAPTSDVLAYILQVRLK